MFMFKVHKTLFSKFGEIVEKLKTDVDRLHLVSKMKKSSISKNILEYFFFYYQNFIFSTISQILKTKFYVF